MRYPEPRRDDIVDVIHGHSIADPYRWLEDAASPDTKAWCEAQDDLVRKYLDSLPGRDALAARLRQLMPGVVGMPVVRPGRLFFMRRAQEDDLPKLWLRTADGDERVLLDPEELSPDNTITLEAWSVSKEGERLAYQLADAGTELVELRVMHVPTGDVVDGPISLGRSGSVAWLPGGEELFYVRRLEGLPPEEEQFHRRVWRRRLGTPLSDDVMVFGEGRDKRTYYGASTSFDGRWLVLSASVGTEPRNDLYISDLSAAGAPLQTVIEGVDARTDADVARDGRLYLHTNLDAPRFRLAVADPAAPTPDRWHDLLPQTEEVLEDFALTATSLVAVRTRWTVSEITLHDRGSGAARGKVDLPGLGTAMISSPRDEATDDLWIAYTDHVTPARILRHDVATGDTEVWGEPPGAPDTSRVVARQVFYASPDGTQIPMFVLSREDVDVASGPHPTILYGYGGFNVPMAPSYSAGVLAWVERGGVYAVANLRGGSEGGEDWHRAGMRDRKQNVFDDFIAAGDWLVANGWTEPARLGISGGSNGGLLVGAVLTQRPDLFRSVVCSAPLLDMLRYELFGLGATWNDEYGRADDPDEFSWLLGYSPYHRVVDGTEYPAVLFTVFDSDSRVDPLHARKMCAALQHATASDPAERPVLFRREKDVGHGQRSVGRMIDLQVDTASFHAAQLGLRPL